MYGRGVAGEIEVSSGGQLEVLDEYFAIAGGKLTLADSTLLLPNQLAVFDGADGATGRISLDHQAQLSAHYVNADRGGELSLKGESSLSGYWLEVRSGLTEVDNSVINLGNRVFVTNLQIQTTDPGVLTLSNGSRLVSAFQASLGNAQVLVEGGSVIQNAIGVPGELGYSPSKTASILARNAGESAVVRVEDEGSLWNSIDGFLTVGFGGRGTLEVAEGGTAKSVGGQIGRATTANGRATISGAGSSWQIEEALYVGGSDTAPGGTGKLVAENQGAVYIESKLHLWQNGTVEVRSTGIVRVGHFESNLIPGNVAVGTGGTLSGTGTIVGNTTIAGGTLAPGAS
jgi:T5SS/PEP-CTERM-associated repeat protein